MTALKRGRARDRRIDENVLAATVRQLSAYGYEALSVAAVADEANTTRQAVYRRWATKSDLVAASMGAMADVGSGDLFQRTDSAAPFDALVAELEDFRRGVSRPGRLSLVGTILQDGTDDDARRRYRQRVVAPRRQRLGAILRAAQDDGLIDPDADLEVATTMLTGSWYERALAGQRPPASWAHRTAALIWRAVGGDLQPSTVPVDRSVHSREPR